MARHLFFAFYENKCRFTKCEYLSRTQFNKLVLINRRYFLQKGYVMGKIKNFFQHLSKGQIVCLATSIVMILAAVVYIACYANYAGIMDNMSWPSVICFFVGAFVSFGLMFVSESKYASIPQLVCSLGGFCFFVYKIYTYASAAATGIDSNWEPQFFLVAGFSLLALIGSITSFIMINFCNEVLPKAITAAMATLLSIAAVGGVIANENANQINHALNLETFKKVEKESTGEEDAEYFKSKYNSIKDLKAAGKELCETAEGEGLTLLKNENNALPLDKNDAKARKVTIFSNSSVSPIYSGTGSGSIDVSAADTPTIKSALQDAGLEVNTTLWDWYNSEEGQAYKSTTGYTGKGVTGPKTIGEAPFSVLEEKTGSSWSEYGGAAIYVLSRVGGEGSDSPRHGHTLSEMTDSDGTQGDTTDGEYLKLSPKEKEILKGLKAKKEAGVFQKVIVLLNYANPVESDFLKSDEYGIDAAIWMGTPGISGLNAVGKALVGDINPSGHLSQTLWADHRQNPALSNFGVSIYEGSPDGGTQAAPNQDRCYVVYQEGIYLGYKYTETRYEDFVLNRAKVGSFDYDKVVSYPFGFGLSYSQFEYSNFKVTPSGNGSKKIYTVTVDVENTSNVPGKDVVQVYINKPYDENNGNYNSANGVEASSSELVGFKKTELLEAHEKVSVSIEVSERSFASYDAKGAGTYVVTGGNYYLSIGNGAHEALNNVLAKKGANASAMSGSGNSSLSSNAISLDFDAKTWSTSEETGAKVGNLFQDCDYNNYEHKVAGDEVKYISRSDWEGTTVLDWNGGVKLHYNDKLDEDLDALGVQGEVKIPEDTTSYPTMGANNGMQLITLRVDEDGNEIPYDNPAWETLLDNLTFDGMVEVVRDGMRCSKAISEIGKPECVDHNGPTGLTERYKYGPTGLATRKDDPDKELRGTCYPSSAILASSFNINLSYQVGYMIAEDAVWAGYAGLYGPGSNIQRTPYSGRNYEYYSECAFLSGIICGYECAAMEGHGLYVYNKHFALNEMEDMRRGVQTWANEQTIRETYLKAFELPIGMTGKKYTPEGSTEEITLKGASGVMVAMNRVGLYWTGMHHSFMTDFLRTECGMTGIAVTDMWYGTATPYINAAAMLVAGTNLVDGSIKAEELEGLRTNHGEAVNALRESIHRICYSTVHSIAMNGISSSTVLVPITPFWQTLLKVLDAVLATGTAAGLGWMIFVAIKDGKKEKKEQSA